LNPSTPFIVLPKYAFIPAVYQLLSNAGSPDIECTESLCLVKRPCSSIQGPAMTFSLDDGKFFEVPRQALLIESAKFKLNKYEEKDYCVIGIATASDDSPQDQAIFGSQFMQHYYTVIDHENLSYGIALAVGSRGYITDSFVTNSFMFKIAGTVMAVLVGTFIVAFTLAKCR
jgi:hypothetical protein